MHGTLLKDAETPEEELARARLALAMAREDFWRFRLLINPQKPGSGGKESAESTVRNLAGLRVFTDKPTGAKEVRAEPFVAQCQNDNVRLVAGR
jgi:phage terminase large subunit-like protein